MLRDITIGQHFPGNSPVHRMDPRMKLLLTIAYIIMLFAGSGNMQHPNFAGLAVAAVFLALLYMAAKIPLKVIAKSLKPILPIILFSSVLNLFFLTGEGAPLVQWGFFTIYREGVAYAVMIAVRIVCLIAGTSLLTYTTSPIQLTDGLERLLSPLKKLHAPVHELSMMMSIALRFIPTLIEETEKIISAQKARGADFESGNLVQRAKAMIPILVPLFISAFRRADELATAMECRLYRGDVGRTRMRQLKITRVDICALVIFVLVCAAVLLLRPHGL